MNSSNSRDHACWLLADNRLSPGRDASDKNQRLFKSLLKHTLLFNVFRQTLVLSDSQVINNASFRLLLRRDEEFKRLMIQSQMVKIAIRTNESGRVESFCKLKDAFTSAGKYFFPQDRHPRLDGEEDELETLEKCPSIAYDLGQISDRYERTVLAVLHSQAASERLPKSVLDAVKMAAAIECTRIRQKSGVNARLGWIFFHQDLENYLNSGDWQKHKPTINDLAQAPFHSGLPSVLQADPIYAKDHARGFEILRGVRKRKSLREPIRLEFNGRLGLAEYQEGLNLLDSSDIFDLVDSDEAQAYAEARRCIENTDESLTTAIIALREYALKIEDRIIGKCHELKIRPNRHSRKVIDASVLEFFQTGLKVVELASLKFDWLGVGKMMLDRLVLDRLFERNQQTINRNRQTEEAERNEARRALGNQWETGANTKIEQEVIIQAPDLPGTVAAPRDEEIETFYTSKI